MTEKSIAEILDEVINREWKEIDEEKEMLFKELFNDSNPD